MRKRFLAGLSAFVLAGTFLFGTVPAQAATPNDTECTKVALGSNTTWNSERVKKYVACRDDKIDSTLQGLTPSASPTASPTPSATPTPTVTPTPTPSASQSPTASPTPTVTPTPTPTPTSQPALLGWQLTKTNVGLAPFGLSCASLPVYTGSLSPAKGTKISNVKITGNLDLSAGGITIDKSCIQPKVGNGRALISNDICGNECEVTALDTVTITNSEFDGDVAPLSSISAACAFRGIGTLQRNYMHGMDSGICFFGTGFNLNGIAEQNYITGLRYNDGAHREAATVRDLRLDRNPNRYVSFANNRLDTQGPGVTGSMFIQPTWVNISNVTLTGNYLEGEGYNLYLENKGGVYANMKAINNRFRPLGWGPSVVSSGVGWAQFTDNYIYDSTKPDGKGAAVRA